MFEEIVIGLQLASVILLLTFLWGFYRFYARIRPFIDKFSSPKGGLHIPTIKEAIGYGIMKAVDTVDFGKMLGGGPRR